jgi:hypothetical protein
MNKTNFIEELFESEIYNVSRFKHHSNDFSDILNNILKTGKELEAILGENEKALFLKYMDLQEHYVTANEFESFAEGFRLGAGCMLDTFMLKNDSK